MTVVIEHTMYDETVTSTGFYDGVCSVGDTVTIECSDENSGSEEITGKVVEIIKE